MKDFRDLKVWKKSHLLTLEIYKVTSTFPKEEIYGITSQMRRSSSSIPTNIAEGCGRGSDAEFVRFLFIAMGSANELDYQLLLARDLKFLNEEAYLNLYAEVVEIKKMLSSLINKIKSDN
ncbi:MAG: four helix bundle protein [Ignavibacteriales bacterium]|nr:four helix bundle protein [Ignavibacteriales bacterium]